jgi:hypothetical protein
VRRLAGALKAGALAPICAALSAAAPHFRRRDTLSRHSRVCGSCFVAKKRRYFAE